MQAFNVLKHVHVWWKWKEHSYVWLPWIYWTVDSSAVKADIKYGPLLLAHVQQTKVKPSMYCIFINSIMIMASTNYLEGSTVNPSNM